MMTQILLSASPGGCSFHIWSPCCTVVVDCASRSFLFWDAATRLRYDKRTARLLLSIPVILVCPLEKVGLEFRLHVLTFCK